MNSTRAVLRRIFVLLAALFFGCSSSFAQQSRWVHQGTDGKLVYTYTSRGDRIPDFSYAGYEGGGVALPRVSAKRVVKPSGADDTDAIQAAIDAVSALPLINGFRGAVELAPGQFRCARTLLITTSGVVLRGAGDGDNGTTIEMTGVPHLALRIAGQLQQSDLGVDTTITDAYVPAGASVIHVADAANLHPGDLLLIRKPVTQSWTHFMGMDNMARHGRPEYWIRAPYLEVRRRIAAVHGNAVTLAVPLMDDYDTRFFDGGHALVSKIELSGQISHVGVEDLRFVAPKRRIALGEPAFSGAAVRDVVDSWFRSVALLDTTNGISINSGSERLTFLKCNVVQEAAVTSHAKPADFACNGSQILFDRCTGSGDSTFYIVTQAGEQGPVVALNCRFLGNGAIEPHQRWSTGLLIDNCEVPSGGIDLMNRGEMGSGHGWPIGWSVVWNSSAQRLGMNQPPGSYIWSIGNRGEQTDPAFPVFDGGPKHAPLPTATVNSPGKPVQPRSLYLAQLKERLSEDALKNIGY
ncbi:MAG TPA: hypothetical protein VGR47_09820 [Terracidiphilus sp.]|nr:hypothetical protein [Terracidiphilus sp.]